MTEIDLVTPEAVLVALQVHCRGSENGLSGRDLVTHICNRSSPSLERKLRSVVQELIEYGHPIGSISDLGYYWITSPEELGRVCKWHYSRAISSLRRVSKLKKLALPPLVGQLTLPVGSEPQVPPISPKKSFSESKRIGLAIHLPVEIHELLEEYLALHGEVSRDELLEAALTSFLTSQGEGSL